MTARTTDPATSHLAATYIDGKRPGLRDAFLMALKALGPSTANEIADWCVQKGLTANAESVRKRAKELIVDGLIELAGERACKRTGLKAGTVRLKDEAVVKADGQKGRSEQKGVQADAEVVSQEAERVKAVAEYMRNERGDLFIISLANEMAAMAKMGTWPAGDSNQYIVAIESAALAGLIERSGSNVRRVQVKPEVKIVQKGLFDANS